MRTVGDATGGYDVKAESVAGLGHRIHRDGRSLFVIGATLDAGGELVVTVQPTSVPGLAKKAARRVLSRA